MLSLFFSRLGGGRAVVSRWGGATRGILGGGRPITKFLPGECLDGREEPIRSRGALHVCARTRSVCVGRGLRRRGSRAGREALYTGDEGGWVFVV
eukprot:1328342-Amorphochlora_amoeboformis.AAC.2